MDGRTGPDPQPTSYPPIIIYKRDREKYLALADGDPRPLAQMFARALLHSLNRFVFPAVRATRRLGH